MELELSEKHLAACKVAFIQVAASGIYSFTMNKIIDPNKDLCNPPGLISLLSSSALDVPWLQSVKHRHGHRRQSYHLDSNLLAMTAMLALMLCSLLEWIPDATDEMDVPFVPLFLGLIGLFTTETVGRCQRSEKLKSAEAIVRWTWVVIPLSLLVLVGSGWTAFSFFLSVIFLRYLSDTCNVVFRFFASNTAGMKPLVMLRAGIQLSVTAAIVPLVIIICLIVILWRTIDESQEFDDITNH